MGCKNSTNISQPGGAKPSPQKSSAKKSPHKSASKFKIKKVSESELKKHKPEDIIAFIKSGSLPMVAGLIEHYQLELAFLSLRSTGFNFQMSEGKDVSRDKWNPFLWAIAQKQEEIARYFLEEMDVSIRLAGTCPPDLVNDYSDSAEQQIFCLQLAIINKDIKMLETLWNVHTAWEQTHFIHLIKFLVAQQYAPGLAFIFKSHTTDVVFNSQSLERQSQIVYELLNLIQQQQKDYINSFVENLRYKPFSLIAIHAILDDSCEFLTTKEKAEHIEKSHMDISVSDWGHFKYSNLHSTFQSRLAEFESKEDEEVKPACEKLKTLLETYDAKHAEHQYFKNQESYNMLEDDLQQAFYGADLPAIQKIVAEVDLRRLPTPQGNNYQSQIHLLNQHPYIFWPLALHMIHRNQANSEAQIDVLKYLLTSHYSIRQCLRQTDSKNSDSVALPRVPQVQGACHLVTLEGSSKEVFKFLWSEAFVNVWSRKHFEMTLETAYILGKFDYLEDLLNQACGQNVFLSMTEAEKLKLVKDVYTKLNSYEETKPLIGKVLCRDYYISYLLIILIERDNFRKMTDFTLYEECLKQVGSWDLEYLSCNTQNYETYMNFMRYVTLLGGQDEKKVQGQKLIDMIYQLEKFKSLKNQSLQIIENESLIREEEGMEEVEERAKIHSTVPHKQKVVLKNFNLPQLYYYIRDRNQDAIIQQLSQSNLTDLYAIRGSPDEYYDIYVSDGEGSYQRKEDSMKNLNLLQIAIHLNMQDLIKYLLHEHKFLNAQRKPQCMDPRFILSSDSNDRTQTLRLAIMATDDVGPFSLLWRSQLFGVQDLQEISHFLKWTDKKWAHVYQLLSEQATHSIFQNCSSDEKQGVLNLFNDGNLGYSQYINDISKMVDDFSRYEPLPGEDRIHVIYNLIKDDEVDQLREVLSQHYVKDIGNLTLNFELEEDEEVLPLRGAGRVFLSQLNLVQFAAYRKSQACFQYLVETFGLRQSQGNSAVTIVQDKLGDVTFSNVLLPIVAKSQDQQILNQITSNSRFVMNFGDFESFVKCCWANKWVNGLKVFLNSTSAQFYFSSFTLGQQRELVQLIYRTIVDVDDLKTRKTLIHQILDEVLTKRPYTSAFVLVLAASVQPKEIDTTRFARECLKYMTGEDFIHYFWSNDQGVREFEDKFQNIQGANFENEMAKIAMRYRNEGKPESDQVADMGGRRVRFGDANVDSEDRI